MINFGTEWMLIVKFAFKPFYPQGIVLNFCWTGGLLDFRADADMRAKTRTLTPAENPTPTL
jgi:hypothetical protein